MLLRLGAGPQFLALSPAGAAPPRFDRFSLSVEGFDAARASKQLAAHGITSGDASKGALTFSDPDGIVVQLHDTTYCGGDGALGNMCRVEPSAKKGLLAARDWSHLTVFTGDAARSNAFYQRAVRIERAGAAGAHGSTARRGRQDPVPHVRRGRSEGRRPAPAGQHQPHLPEPHGFDRDGILKTLESYGIKPRGDATGTPPLVSYVTNRMPNRGGAPEGTPELYFTDPDGLPIQIQDARYCGGGGYLGDVCAG